jgi:hypothetical protein
MKMQHKMLILGYGWMDGRMDGHGLHVRLFLLNKDCQKKCTLMFICWTGFEPVRVFLTVCASLQK